VIVAGSSEYRYPENTFCISLNCPLNVPQLSFSRAPIDSPSDLSLRSPQLSFHTHLQKAIHRARANFRQAALRTALRHCNRSSHRSLLSVASLSDVRVSAFRERVEFVSWSESVMKSQTAHEYEKKRGKKEKRMTDRFERFNARERSNATNFRFSIATLERSAFRFPFSSVTRPDVDISAVIAGHSRFLYLRSS